MKLCHELNFYVTQIVDDHIRKLFPKSLSSLKYRVSFSVDIDATKVEKLLQMCANYNVVLGRTAPRYFMLKKLYEDEDTLEK